MIKALKKTSIRMLLIVIFIIMLLFSLAFRNQIYDKFLASLAFYDVYLGDKKYKEGKLIEAINYYNKGLELYSKHTRARYNLGNIYVAIEDYNSAINCYEEALRHAPNFLNARINLALLLAEQLKDYDRAIAEYEKAVNTKPFIVDIPFLYKNAKQIKASKATAYYDMGLAYKSKSLLYADDPILYRKFLKKASKSYKESLVIDDLRYETHYNRAITLHLLGNLTEATKEYCKAIKIGPMNYDVHYNFAILLRDKKEYNDSVSELHKAALILDTNNTGVDSRYIFDVLNEVTQKAVILKRYTHLTESIDDSEPKSDNLAWINGKIVDSEELDKAILENFRSCNSCNK